MESRPVTHGTPATPAGVTPLFHRELNFYGRVAQAAIGCMSHQTFQITYYALNTIAALATLLGSWRAQSLAYRALPIYLSLPAMGLLGIVVSLLFNVALERVPMFVRESIVQRHENQWIEFFGGKGQVPHFPRVHKIKIEPQDFKQTAFLFPEDGQYFHILVKEKNTNNPPQIFNLYFHPETTDQWAVYPCANPSPFTTDLTSIEARMEEVRLLRDATHPTFELAVQG